MFLGRGYNTADAFAAIQSVAVDDNASAFLDTDEDHDRAGALTITNFAVVNFDATPTLNTSTNVITAEATFAAGVANFTHRRIASHNAASGSVTSSSNTLVTGIDGQTAVKTADFSRLYRFTTSMADNS